MLIVVKMGDKELEISPDEIPVLFVFNSDEERKNIADHLTNMQPKKGKRGYILYPDGLAADYMTKFAKKHLK